MLSDVRVSVQLKDKQEVGVNKWKITLHGEERVLTNSIVFYNCENLEEAINSFRMSEIDRITITQKNDEGND